MKIPTILLTLPAVALVSCNQLGNNSDNPYGAPSAAAEPADNPYAVPQANGETGAYAGNYAPYQPLPGVATQPYTPPVNLPAAPAAGNPNYLPSPDYTPTPDPGSPSVAGAGTGAAGATISHTVAKGDTLWGLARKYNTTVEEIQAVNNMTDTNARLGQTLLIPSR